MFSSVLDEVSPEYSSKVDMYKVDITKALLPAVSIELLHIFSLVHDDIMDNDDFRHNKPTIHNKWSIPVGILSGDAILALAFKRLNKCNGWNKILILKQKLKDYDYIFTSDIFNHYCIYLTCKRTIIF